MISSQNSQNFQPFSEENKISNDNNQEQSSNRFLINKILDEMGFTKYHVLLFLSNSFFLLCAGMQEIIHVILLSIINDTHNLSFYHLACMNSIEYLGITVASILVNILTNYLSNRKSIILFVLFSLVFTGLSLTSYNYYFAAVNRFFLGICLGILDVLIYLNLFESAPTKIRGFVASIILVFFPLGAFLLSVVCYFQLKEGDHHLNYRLLLLMPFIVTCVICLLVIVFMEESPRQLFGLKKFQEGVETMKKITIFNKDDTYLNDKFTLTKKQSFAALRRSHTTQDPKIQIDQIIDSNKRLKLNEDDKKSNESHEKSSFFQKIKVIFNEQYRSYTILFWIIASLAGFVFNGIFFMLPATAPKIEKATFLDLILFEGMEIPSNFIASLLIENQKIGRLYILRIGFVVTFLISLINITLGSTILLFDCFLKFFLTIPLNVLIVYCSEIYDSDIRTMGLSAVNFWRKISSLIAPFVMSYMTLHYGAFSTYLIYAPFLCLCAICTLYFKTESRGIPLDEIKKLSF